MIVLSPMDDGDPRRFRCRRSDVASGRMLLRTPVAGGTFPVFAIRPDYLVAHGLSHRSESYRPFCDYFCGRDRLLLRERDTVARAGRRRWKASRIGVVLALQSSTSVVDHHDRRSARRYGGGIFATIIALRLFGSEALAIVIGVLTFVLLIFGDIVPKTLAAKHALTVVLAMAYPVYWVQQLMKPILLVLEPVINALTGGKGVTVPHVSEEEVKIMLDEGGRAGMIETEEVKMIKNVFQLKDITAEDAMTPRIYMFALEGNLRLKDAQEAIFKSKYSRIPVYDTTLDNITGILYRDKALMGLAQGRYESQAEGRGDSGAIRPARKDCGRLMKQFQADKRHMAIVGERIRRSDGTSDAWKIYWKRSLAKSWTKRILPKS